MKNIIRFVIILFILALCFFSAIGYKYCNYSIQFFGYITLVITCYKLCENIQNNVK